ncbi:binder of sperm protein homolog 1 isoform X1 [Arvicanthis niloticus]|uniref:binder of sperm protein homolog 1 isoform X1 n=1 Tax=Arvicanthis niloticus TaxID=61156 RepID=UPI00148627BD|nr:binder of sperm protein homolog 1 isoform X1 [Arvicanthis niloticus]
MAQPVAFLLVSICLFHSLFSFQEEDYYAPTIESIIRNPETEDGVCVFPFWYRSEIFYDCVNFNLKHKWCSLNKTFQGYWKYCALTDYAPCTFPFWYRRMIYWDCTEDGEVFGKRWCSLTPNYNKDHVWKYCI